MSTTFSTRKRVALARDTGSNRLFAALFEETYESNVCPHHPRWSAIFFGDIDAAREFVVHISASVEGGCLQEPGRNATPSSYLKHWREAFAQASTLEISHLVFGFGTGFYQIDPDRRADIERILWPRGLQLQRTSNADIVTLDAREPFALEVVAQVLQQKWPSVYPWRLFEVGQCSAFVSQDALPVPLALQGDTSSVAVYQLPLHHSIEPLHVLVIGEEASCTGWAYSTIAAFMRRYVAPMERRCPGVAEGLIRRFRAELARCPLLPTDQTLRLRVSEGNWLMPSFEQIARSLGIAPPVREVSTTMAALQAAGSEHLLASFEHVLEFPDLSVRPAMQQGLFHIA